MPPLPPGAEAVYTIDWEFEITDTNPFDEEAYAAGLASLVGDDLVPSDFEVTAVSVGDTRTVTVTIAAPSSEAANAAASVLDAQPDVNVAQAVGATGDSVTTISAPSVAVVVEESSPPPTPFAPLQAGKMYVGEFSFKVQVLAASRRRLHGRRLRGVEEDPATTPADVKAAVEDALAQQGYEYTAEVTGPDDESIFSVTIATDGPDCFNVMQVVEDPDFTVEIESSIGEEVDVNGPTCTYAIADIPPSPPSDATPSTLPDPNDDLGEIDDTGANVETTGSSDSGLGGGIIFLIILICLCLICPILCCLYAAARFGPANTGLWFRYKFCHTNPTLPAFYMPKEDRDRIKKQLGLGGKYDQQVEGESSVKQERV